MQHVLVKIGCKILTSNYSIEHPDLINYVHEADAAGVLDSIYEVSSTDSITQLLQCLEANERDELRRFFLNPTWFVGKKMDDSHIQNSKWLPIYRVYNGESAQNSKYSDLINPQKFLPHLIAQSACYLETDVRNSVMLLVLQELPQLCAEASFISGKP
ncbi:hypothetical protein BUALT_Bualt09G0019200 [Buddleja alternifolia]|uniref:Uncharacterized protein n=1 Tax=Buddleja alternifolia TaxID=168488 RepID=A0AAV6X5V1_9LAMI|nr:hypothetical protein BUALT_Bualt09G0019200 [Buddleja alternifolia]